MMNILKYDESLSKFQASFYSKYTTVALHDQHQDQKNFNLFG